MLIGAFFVTLFIPHIPVINNISTGTILFYSFLYNTIQDKWRIIRQRPALWMIFIFNIIELINSFFSKNHHDALRLLALRSPLLIFPIALGTVELMIKLKVQILKIYCSIITLTAMVCLISSLVVYLKTGDSQFFYNDNLTMSIHMQSAYFAFMVTFAILFLLFEFWRESFFKINRIILSVVIALLLITEFFLASRTSLIILSITGFAIVLYNLIRAPFNPKKIWLVILFLSAILLIAGFFPRTVQRFKEIQYTAFSYNNSARESHFNMPLKADQWNGANIRLAIWRCGWDIIQEHFWFGIPLGDKRTILYDQYRKKGFQIAVQTRKNLHNNYLDVLSNLGIFGFLAFLTGFIISPLIITLTRKDVIGSMIILSLGIAFIGEVYFDRTIGCLITSFFVSFVLAYNKTRKDLLSVIC